MGRRSCLAAVLLSTCQDPELRTLTCCETIGKSLLPSGPQSWAPTCSQRGTELTSSVLGQTDIVWGGTSLTPVTFLTKTGDMNLAKRKQQTQPCWGTFSKTTGLNSKNVKVMKHKERPRNGSRLKDSKGTGQSNVTCDLGGVLEQETISYTGHQWGKGQNVNMDCVGWITVLYQCYTSWFWLLYCYIRVYHCSEEVHAEIFTSKWEEMELNFWLTLLP